jgi:hypothetical protein
VDVPGSTARMLLPWAPWRLGTGRGRRHGPVGHDVSGPGPTGLEIEAALAGTAGQLGGGVLVPGCAVSHSASHRLVSNRGPSTRHSHLGPLLACSSPGRAAAHLRFTGLGGSGDALASAAVVTTIVPHFPRTLSFMAARRRRDEDGISIGTEGPAATPNATVIARGWGVER